MFTPWNAFNNEPWKYLWRWFWRWHQRCWCWQGEVVELLEVLGWLQVLHGSPLVICQYPPQDTRETGAHIGLLSLHIAIIIIIIIITRQGRSDKAPTLLLCAQLRVEATSPSKNKPSSHRRYFLAVPRQIETDSMTDPWPTTWPTACPAPVQPLWLTPCHEQPNEQWPNKWPTPWLTSLVSRQFLTFAMHHENFPFTVKYWNIWKRGFFEIWNSF